MRYFYKNNIINLKYSCIKNYKNNNTFICTHIEIIRYSQISSTTKHSFYQYIYFSFILFSFFFFFFEIETSDFHSSTKLNHYIVFQDKQDYEYRMDHLLTILFRSPTPVLALLPGELPCFFLSRCAAPSTLVCP